MGWLLFILSVYFLCLLVERALVGISSHDIEVLKNEESLAARRVIALSFQLRPVLAALMLARIMMISTASIIVAASFQNTSEIKTWLYTLSDSAGLPAWIPWWVSGGILALTISSVIWGIQKLEFHKNKSALFLKRFWWFAFFWSTLFKVFTHKEKGQHAIVQEHPPEPASPDALRGASEKRELELLKSIVQFGDVTVKQVMQPRSRVVAVDFKTGFQALLQVVRQSGYSRLPVYDEDLDNITGILYVKDLVSYLDKGDFEWQPLIQDNVLMVPEAKRGSELLQEFKQQRLHMAVVVDEYGGMAGIVTMEDILEEVTGDIRDEFDRESEFRYRKIDDFTYIFEGQTLLNDICRLVGLPAGTFDEVRGTADTLAGLALELRGDIPLTGTEMTWNGHVLSVINADKRRIEQIKLSLPRPLSP